MPFPFFFFFPAFPESIFPCPSPTSKLALPTSFRFAEEAAGFGSWIFGLIFALSVVVDGGGFPEAEGGGFPEAEGGGNCDALPAADPIQLQTLSQDPRETVE